MHGIRLFPVIVFFSLVGMPIGGIAQEDAVYKKVQALDWKYTGSPGNIAGKATIKLDGGVVSSTRPIRANS